MNKWKRRFREQIHLLEVRVSQYDGIHQQLSNAKQERDAALKEVEELRDAVGREHEAFMQANDESEKLQMQVRDMDVRFSYLDKSGPAEIEKLKTALYEANKGVCLWRGKDYNASRELKNIVAENIRLDSTLTKEKVYHESAVSERNTALQKVAELRQDVLRLSTELARVQGVCDDEILGYEETASEAHTFRVERDALLAWQRGVREAWNAYDAEFEVEASTLDALREAIEAEPKGET